MLTLLMGFIDNDIVGQMIGYVLTALEIAIVIVTLLKFFVPVDSKFGKLLNHILKGLQCSKRYLDSRDNDDASNDGEEEDTNEDKSSKY